MKNKNGFVVIAIVVVILIVGIGAYYFGKSSNVLPNVVTEENLPETNQVADIFKTDCLPTTTPWIKVLSPNGGEVYTVGQDVNFKWKSCNVSNTVHLTAEIIGQNNYSNGISFLCEGGSLTWGPECLNDEEQKLETSRPGVFKLKIFSREGPIVSDTSDNPFTINSTNINWLKSPKFDLYYQDNFNIIEYYADMTGKNVSEIEGIPFLNAILKTNSDVGIGWGGYWNNNRTTCTSSDFGIFQYGVSRLACVKGYRASIGHMSARAVLSQEELNIFGDFVLKNQ